MFQTRFIFCNNTQFDDAGSFFMIVVEEVIDDQNH